MAAIRLAARRNKHHFLCSKEPRFAEPNSIFQRGANLACVGAMSTDIKMITAIVQPFWLEHIHAALSEAGILGVTVTACSGYGRQRGLTKTHWREEYANTLVPKVMLELAVPADRVKTVTDAIIKAARTGQIGDGKIFISPLEEAIRVRTNERDQQALL